MDFESDDIRNFFFDGTSCTTSSASTPSLESMHLTPYDGDFSILNDKFDPCELKPIADETRKPPVTEQSTKQQNKFFTQRTQPKTNCISFRVVKNTASSTFRQTLEKLLREEPLIPTVKQLLAVKPIQPTTANHTLVPIPMETSRRMLEAGKKRQREEPKISKPQKVATIPRRQGVVPKKVECVPEPPRKSKCIRAGLGGCITITIS